MRMYENLKSAICEAFRDMEENNYLDLGNGYALTFYDGNEWPYHYIFECGVAVGKLNEDGDIDYNDSETEIYLLENFYQTFDDIFTNGDMILASMANQICKDYGWCNTFVK